jgi:AI-2 transport protein TqsA
MISETEACTIPGENPKSTQTVMLVIIMVIAVGFALYFLRPVLLPLLFGVFLYLCLTPLIDLQIRLFHMPYRVALISTTLIGTLLLLVVVAIAASSVSQMAADAKVYQEQLNGLVEKASSVVPSQGVGGDSVKRYLRTIEGSLGGLVSSAIYAFSSLISNSVLVVLITAYILIGGTATRRQGLIADLEVQVHCYINQTVWLSALTGLLVGIALAVLGVRFAMVFGLFAFLLNFIPTIGPVLATLLPLPIVLLSPGMSPTTKVLAIAVPAVIEFLMGQVVTTKIRGRSLALHPVTVLVFLLFFQMIWGIGGAFLSTPIAAVLKIVFDHFQATRPLACLMEGQLDVLLAREQAVAIDTSQIVIEAR